MRAGRFEARTELDLLAWWQELGRTVRIVWRVPAGAIWSFVLEPAVGRTATFGFTPLAPGWEADLRATIGRFARGEQLHDERGRPVGETAERLGWPEAVRKNVARATSLEETLIRIA